MRKTVVIQGKAYTLPRVGNRCPRCHRPAPRQDGVVCALCAPRTELTYTNPVSGITHLYRYGCDATLILAGLPLKWINVGDVPVTCLECIAKEVAPRPNFGASPSKMVDYAKEDAETTLKALLAFRKA